MLLLVKRPGQSVRNAPFFFFTRMGLHWDVDELDKVSDEAHDGETDRDRFRDLDVLCQRMSTLLGTKDAQSPLEPDRYLFATASCTVS